MAPTWMDCFAAGRFNLDDWVQVVVLVVIFVLAPLAKKLSDIFRASSTSDKPSSADKSLSRQPRERATPLPPARPTARPMSPPPVVTQPMTRGELARGSQAAEPAPSRLEEAEQEALTLPDALFEMLGVPKPEIIIKRTVKQRTVPPTRAPALVRQSSAPRSSHESKARPSSPAHRKRIVAAASPPPAEAPDEEHHRLVPDRDEPPAPSADSPGPDIFADVRRPTRRSLRQAIIFREILAPPLSLRTPDDRF